MITNDEDLEEKEENRDIYCSFAVIIERGERFAWRSARL